MMRATLLIGISVDMARTLRYDIAVGLKRERERASMAISLGCWRRFLRSGGRADEEAGDLDLDLDL